MKTIFSNYSPAHNITSKSLDDVWFDLFKSAQEIFIATGYVSHDAIEELYSILEQNPEHIKNLQLFVGMHYLEGFTKFQYESLIRLNNFLIKHNRGEVYISKFIKFHGKLYSFHNKDKVDSVIGSANLSYFWNSLERTYETMLHIDEPKEALMLSQEIKKIIDSLGDNISTVPEPKEFKKFNFHLENHLGVEKILEEELSKLWSSLSEYKFNIPIKTEPKSNLNTFFGKGRKDKRGFVKPRSWYEVEIIVGKNITKQDGYPLNKSFTVITDDGWTFKCKTSGTNSKNFRSADDLKILGKWIKGRLEAKECLKTGQEVTNEVLDCYGSHHMELRSTENLDLWLLSFRGN